VEGYCFIAMEFLECLRTSLNNSEVVEVDPCSLLNLLKANLPVKFYDLPEEAKDLISVLFKSCKAVCPHCTSADTSYRYLNNKQRCKFIQPRFLCSNCKKCFTVGGRKNGSKHSAMSTGFTEQIRNSTPTKRKCVFPNQSLPPGKKPSTQFEKLQAAGISTGFVTGNQMASWSLCDYICGYQPNEGECQIPISTLPGLIDVHEHEQKSPLPSYKDDGDHWVSSQTTGTQVQGEAAINNFSYVEENQPAGELFNDMRDYFDGPGIELALGNSTKNEGISDFVYNIIRQCDEYQTSTGESELCSLFQTPLFTAN
ncbi:hypothetical protein KI387_015467, partial [Taxus chinensis]